MLTLVGAVILALLFFAAPVAVIIGALGLWVGGVIGAVIGAVIGLFLQFAAE
jgi:hypothetical protein